jgi:hypothetical protein
VWWLDLDTTATKLHGPVDGGVVNIDCRPIGVSTIVRGQRALVSCADFNVVDQPRAADLPAVTYGVEGPVAAALAKGKPLVLATSDRCLASLRRVTSQSATKQVACLGNAGPRWGWPSRASGSSRRSGSDCRTATTAAAASTTTPAGSEPGRQYAPSEPNTARSVRARIVRSCSIDQLST